MSDHAVRIAAIERRLDGDPDGPGLETRISRIEEDIRDIRAILGRLEPMIIRIDAQLAHLATKAELADLRAELRADLAEKPSRVYLWGVLAALLAAYGCGLAALAILR